MSFRYNCEWSHIEHFYEVWFRLAPWYRRGGHLKEIVDGDDDVEQQTTDID